MSDKTCPVCDDPQIDGIACTPCTNSLLNDIRELPTLMDELQTTITRQSVTSAEKSRRSTEMPLPYDWNGGHTREDVINTVGTWLREMNIAPPNLAGNIRAWCNVLLDNRGVIRKHRAAQELFDELQGCVADVRRAIDTPPTLEFYGQCAVCTRDLYGATDADEVLCRYCDRAGIEARYPTAGRRAGLWQTAPDALVPRRVALAALPVWGMQVAPSTFHGWVREGKIEPRHDEDRPNAVLYRLGDVLDLAATMETQEQTRQVIGWNLTKETMAG